MSSISIPAEVPIEAVPEPAAPVASATNVVRRYGEGDTAVEALRGVSLDVADGRLTAIMGPSGSGKSTLMHTMAGLDRPTSGSVVLDGVENVVLPLSIAGEKPDQEWLDSLLGTFGIADRRSHRPAQLSGGQQQRVSLARALVSRPKVIFADEPTGNLDSSSSEKVLSLLRRSVDELDQTTVMVTHDPRAAAMADRILFLADGRIVKDISESTAVEVLAAMQEVTGR